MSSSEPNSSRRSGRSVLLRASLLACSLAAAWLAGYFLTSSPAPEGAASVDHDGAAPATDLSGLRGARLLNLKTGLHSRPAAGAPYALFIFLSASDCSSCVDELRVWQHLSGVYPASQLEVSAILVRSSVEEATAFLKAYAPTLNFYLDEGEDVERRMKLPEKTPYKVLTNAAGQVLLAEGPQPTASGQQRFGEMVAAVVGPPAHGSEPGQAAPRR